MNKFVKAWAIKRRGRILTDEISKHKDNIISNAVFYFGENDRFDVVRVEIREVPKKKKRKKSP